MVGLLVEVGATDVVPPPPPPPPAVVVVVVGVVVVVVVVLVVVVVVVGVVVVVVGVVVVVVGVVVVVVGVVVVVVGVVVVVVGVVVVPGVQCEIVRWGVGGSPCESSQVQVATAFVLAALVPGPGTSRLNSFPFFVIANPGEPFTLNVTLVTNWASLPK